MRFVCGDASVTREAVRVEQPDSFATSPSLRGPARGAVTSAGGDGVAPLVALLDITELDTNLYAAPSPHYTYRPTIFGGQVAAQALRAATLTVDEERRVHSLHGYFLRPGRPGDPVVLYVERVREGRSFTTRRVVARQHGEAIFTLETSFQVDEPGPSQQVPVAGAPDPDDLPFPDAAGATARFDVGFDVRPVEGGGAFDEPAPRSTPLSPALTFWVRTRGPLGDDHGLHASVLAYVSDMRSGSAALVEGQSIAGVVMASLDHSMWFHRPVRADQWLLVQVRPVSTSGARGLVLGTVHDQAGVHGLTFTQEVLTRPRAKKG